MLAKVDRQPQHTTQILLTEGYGTLALEFFEALKEMIGASGVRFRLFMNQLFT